VVEFGELICLFPPNACRGERCGVLGAQSLQSNVVGFFSLERFLFVFRGGFSSGNLLSASAHKRIGTCIMTYSGREEERAPSIYRSSSWSRSAAVSRVRRSKGFSSVGENVSLLGERVLLEERFR
jgi:hypothetical protein